jgi:hypothetical protein
MESLKLYHERGLNSKASCTSQLEQHSVSVGLAVLDAELAELFVELGSNLSLNSRKVLWDWNLPYALLAERALCSEWSGRRDSNPQLQPWEGRALPLNYSRADGQF